MALIGIIVIDGAVLLVKDLYRKGRLEADIRSTFQSAFPDMPVPADPVDQMRLEITKLRHRVGEPGSGDFLPMLSGLSTALMKHGVSRVQSITYQPGVLSCQIGTLPKETADAIAADLGGAGFAAQADVGEDAVTIRIAQ